MPRYTVSLKSRKRGEDGNFRYRYHTVDAETLEEAKNLARKAKENKGYRIWMVSQAFPPGTWRKVYPKYPDNPVMEIGCRNCHNAFTYDATLSNPWVVCPICGTVLLTGEIAEEEENRE